MQVDSSLRKINIHQVDHAIVCASPELCALPLMAKLIQIYSTYVGICINCRRRRDARSAAVAQGAAAAAARHRKQYRIAAGALQVRTKTSIDRFHLRRKRSGRCDFKRAGATQGFLYEVAPMQKINLDAGFLAATAAQELHQNTNMTVVSGATAAQGAQQPRNLRPNTILAAGALHGPHLQPHLRYFQLQ